MRKQISRVIRHPLSPFKKRTLYSIMAVVAVLAFGTEGMVLIEHWSYVDSFYFVSLIATAEGPSQAPATAAGKIFAAFLAFASVGAVLSALLFVFGPFFGTLFKVGIDYIEKEEEKLKAKVERKK